MNAVVYENLKVIWDYMRLNMTVEPGDCVVGFGCYNDDIALRCAQLYRGGYAPRVLFTGGLGRNTLGLWTQTEAERFAAIAMEAGVPREDIIIENRSTNSAENILFTHAKLEEAGLDTGRLICVHKPFMERRLYAAMQVYSDGTTLKMSVLTNGPRRSAEDLTDAVFKASAPKKGTFAGVRYVERTNTRGGMPLTKCSASQQGQRLSRPFEADYTFWR